MAARATEMSCTAVTITTGMSGYFSLVRSSRPMPSRSAIIRSESINSNSSPEVKNRERFHAGTRLFTGISGSAEHRGDDFANRLFVVNYKNAIWHGITRKSIGDCNSSREMPKVISQVRKLHRESRRTMIFKSKEDVRPQQR